MLCAVTSARLPDFIRAFPTVFIRMPRGLAEFSFAGIDDALAARELALRMLQARRGPVGIVHGPLYSTVSENRLRGPTAAFAEHGLPVPAERQVESPLSMEGGYQGFDTLWRRHPDTGSVFCGSDQIAYGAYRRCRELGVRVPEEVRLYGFDDNR